MPYTLDDATLAPEDAIPAIAEAIRAVCDTYALATPALVLEPGRELVARAGVALYRIGAIKQAGDVTYAFIDGGMADNIRPAIYDAKYEAVVVNRADDAATETVTIAGKYCESGDILVKDALVPSTRPGDVIALPASGAYCLAMASNYNMALKPAVVVVKDGQARLIRRRETYADLLATDVFAE